MKVHRIALASWLVLGMACAAGGFPDDDAGNDETSGPRDTGTGGMDVDLRFDVPPVDRPRPHEVGPNYDAFFAENPPPRYCGPDGGDGGPPPDLPGGTVECPDDLLREGCQCEREGEMRPCWPGLRANRGRGICTDGMTTCQRYDEIFNRWGPCVGYVLPVPGATRGPEACHCFSQGRWEITNLSPCFIQSGSAYWGVSTYEPTPGSGRSMCPTLATGAMPPFMPRAGSDWSVNRLTVDCTGQFELCYTLKAGNVMSPSSADCTMVQVCTRAWYSTRNVAQTLPPLPSWSTSSSTCATRFATTGGYGEMTVLGLSSECDPVDDGGHPFVFNRVGYCRLDCAMNPTRPDCVSCSTGGSGMF